VFPRTTADVAAIVKLADEYRMPVVGRGAGTGLSGGAIPREGGILVGFARMNAIVEMDLVNERATVEPGVVNLDVTGRWSATVFSMRRTHPASAPAP
jgi:glycolate oxidase